MGLVRVLHACLGYLLIFNIWMCSWSLKGFPACDVTQAMSGDYKAIYNSTVFLQKVPMNALLSSYLASPGMEMLHYVHVNSGKNWSLLQVMTNQKEITYFEAQIPEFKICSFKSKRNRSFQN